MSSTDLEILTFNSIDPFVILRQNDIHISFTSSSVFNSIKLYFTLPSVSIQSSWNSIFFTFLVSISDNNSFNLDVRLVRDVVPSESRNYMGGEASLKYTSSSTKNWGRGIFWDIFIKHVTPYLYNFAFTLEHTKLSV